MESPLSERQPTVFVADGDPSVARALRREKPSEGIAVEYCRDSEEFLAACDASRFGCLVSDLRLPGSSVDVLDEVERQGLALPVVIVSANDDPATVVVALRRGARNFLSRSCSVPELWDAIEDALAWGRENLVARRFALRARRRYARLTPGEIDVLDLLVAGLSNREMAERLRRSQRAIEVRRGHLMRKMRAKSLAELVRMALAVEAGPPSPSD